MGFSGGEYPFSSSSDSRAVGTVTGRRDPEILAEAVTLFSPGIAIARRRRSLPLRAEAVDCEECELARRGTSTAARSFRLREAAGVGACVSRFEDSAEDDLEGERRSSSTLSLSAPASDAERVLFSFSDPVFATFLGPGSLFDGELQ